MVGAFLLAGRVFTESRTEKLFQYRFVFRNFFLPMYIASLVAAWIIIADFNEPLRGTGVLGWLSYVSAWAGIVVFVAAPPLMLGFGLLRGRIYPGEATGGAQAGRASHAL